MGRQPTPNKLQQTFRCPSASSAHKFPGGGKSTRPQNGIPSVDNHECAARGDGRGIQRRLERQIEVGTQRPCRRALTPQILAQSRVLRLQLADVRDARIGKQLLGGQNSSLTSPLLRRLK